MTHIEFFGRISDSMGADFKIDLPPNGVSVSALRKALFELTHTDAILDEALRVSRNDEIIAETDDVYPNDQISFMSPFSGG